MKKIFEPLKSPNELAQHLGVHKCWIYKQTRKTGENAIPRIYVGKYLRFKFSEVEGWLCDGRTHR